MVNSAARYVCREIASLWPNSTSNGVASPTTRTYDFLGGSILNQFGYGELFKGLAVAEHNAIDRLPLNPEKAGAEIQNLPMAGAEKQFRLTRFDHERQAMLGEKPAAAGGVFGQDSDLPIPAIYKANESESEFCSSPKPVKARDE